jgi:hypothetical protein
MRSPLVLYICDKKRCENCSYPDCKFTTKINHRLKIENSYDGEDLYERLYDAADQLLDGVYNKDSLAELLMDARNALIHYHNEEKIVVINDVLDKIRAEIEDAAFDSQEIDGEHESLMIVDLNDALDIIDKYKSESEE